MPGFWARVIGGLLPAANHPDGGGGPSRFTRGTWPYGDHCRRLVVGFLLLGGAWLLGSSPAAGALIGAETLIPDELVLVNFQDSGLDWVYAGPTTPLTQNSGRIEPPTFRAAERWRYATPDEWSRRPQWQDFIQPGYTEDDVALVGNWSDHTRYRFASEYWSDYFWVDLVDAAQGYVSNGRDIGDVLDVWETWYVRHTVPEPSSHLLALLGSFGCLWRLRRRDGRS